jgi:hypothetical protein
MNRKRTNLLFYLARLPFLFLYVSFFAVQLFFNFDIANNPGSITCGSLYKTASVGHQYASVHKTNPAKDKKPSIRLNKRFSPKDIPAYNPFIVQSPVYYLTEKLFVAAPGVFIPATFLLSQSFRGPPVVA